MLHNGVGGGNLGQKKTLENIREQIYWPGLRQDVEEWCISCQECARSKSPIPTYRALLIPSQVGFPMERATLDVLGPLLTTKHGNRYVLVISDYFTFFESKLFSEICHLQGVEKTRTTLYHPESDGLVERFNRTLKMMLMTHMGKISEDMWDEELPMLMLAYQTSVQESTKFTQFRLMFGREIKLPVDVIFIGGPAPEENYSGYVSHL